MGPSATVGQSLAEFREAFPDEATCVSYLFDRRWPDGFACRCGGTRYASLNSRAYTYECLGCRHQTSITAGTVMHRSHLRLTKWFSAAHLIATHDDRSPYDSFSRGSASRTRRLYVETETSIDKIPGRS